MNTPAKLSITDSIPTVPIAVIYHSNYGHTKRVAEAIVKGAHQQLPAAQAKAVDVHKVDWDYLDQADLLVFGSAVYM
uniref:flavodoxin family protein n=1 Tax=Psychrobacter sanguinis TaxID=861445 RepID=UPI001918E28B